MYYVYELIDPRNGKVFYVGKGMGDRMHEHEKDARRYRIGAKSLLILDIEGEGHSVLKRKVAQFQNEGDAYDFEALHISYIGLENLTNIKRGGGGVRVKDKQRQIDKHMVRCASMLFKAVFRKKATHLKIFGQCFSIYSILKRYGDGLDDVIARRGLRWVNFIAKEQGMKWDGW